MHSIGKHRVVPIKNIGHVFEMCHFMKLKIKTSGDTGQDVRFMVRQSYPLFISFQFFKHENTVKTPTRLQKYMHWPEPSLVAYVLGLIFFKYLVYRIFFKILRSEEGKK